MADDITILAAVKTSLRIAAATTLFDNDLNELIAAAKKDLITGGVILDNENEPLVRQAIKFYCRANFQNGDSKERELYYDRFERLKIQLGQCQLYREEPDDNSTGTDNTAEGGEGGEGS